MNFANLKEWETPRGNVVEFAIDGKIAWKKMMGIPINTLPVGSSVFMNVNGVRTEFLIVHYGLPSSVYDASCSGIWLLMKDLYETRQWHSSHSNDYANSTIHSYLNNTFLNLLDSNIRRVIKQVKLPYTKGQDKGGSLATGSNGISAKIFLLSYTEVGGSGNSNANIEGAALGFFNGKDKSVRIAYLNGTARWWWLRSPNTDDANFTWLVSGAGALYNQGSAGEQGIRPALILPSSAGMDENFNVLA